RWRPPTPRRRWRSRRRSRGGGRAWSCQSDGGSRCRSQAPGPPSLRAAKPRYGRALTLPPPWGPAEDDQRAVVAAQGAAAAIDGGEDLLAQGGDGDGGVGARQVDQVVLGLVGVGPGLADAV